MRIGAHLSVSKGFSFMINRAVELGADLVQYFSKNPKSFQPKKFSAEQLKEEAEKVAHIGVATVCHSPYVANLSTSDRDLNAKTVDSLVNDLEIAEAYQTPYVVVHCGKHVGQGVTEGINRMVATIDQITAGYQGQAMLLLENTAGQGSELGRTIDELCLIRSKVERADMVGFCFDICHAFAAGINGFNQWDKLGENTEFWEHTPLIHLNDSKFPFGSNKDRHELLGKGEIGETSLKAFISSPWMKDKWIAIETPVEKEDDYALEIRLVKEWLPLS